MKLDYHIVKSAVNAYFGRYVDRDRRPTFFHIKSFYPGLDAVTQAFPAIQKEFDRLLATSGELPQYHELDSGERIDLLDHAEALERVHAGDSWATSRPQSRRAARRPALRSPSVPNMIQAFFSILEPGKSVPEHEGPYLGYLRYHLGLRVPRENPPKLVVNRQDYVWKEGEAVLFDDSWPHSVLTRASETRAVLIVDVRRPLPVAPDMLNRFFIDVMGRHTYGRAPRPQGGAVRRQFRCGVE